jgi:tRNA-dihydrouridine synthase B
MRIRDVEIRPNLVLAPMEGVTDLTFRRLIRQIGGCGLTVTEFVPAGGVAHDSRKIRELVAFDPDERPVSVQLFGREPRLLAEAARMIQDLGPTIIDLNMGCPSKKVCANSGGSSLLREPDTARDIIRAMRAAIRVPFTVKMRTGWDPQHKNAPEVAWMCQEEGVDAVAVHWRTRTDLYGGVRELDTIAAVKQRLSIPVIANGDVVDAASALDTLARTGADGLMVGRGAIRDPWVFRKIEAAMAGNPPFEVSLAEHERVLLGYADAILARFRSEHGALGRIKKIARYFVDGVPRGDELRDLVWHSETLDEARGRIIEFFSELRADVNERST